jgi:hypothetical protein
MKTKTIYTEELTKEMKGATIKEIRISPEYLHIATDRGGFLFVVTGDCCSESFFYDFIGVKNLLDHEIVEIEQVELDHKNTKNESNPDSWNGYIEYYGYRIIVEDTRYDRLSAVVSFRNFSNGYYGGEMEWVQESQEKIEAIVDGLTLLTQDILEVEVPEKENDNDF